MTTPSNSAVQNLLPVQAYFNLDGSFNTFIGQGKPFYATANPVQSGLAITNSTLDSSPIGSITPSTGAFTSFSTTTGTISTNASGATDIVNLLTLQSYAAGISWKNPVTAATTANITLSGPQTIDGVAVVVGNTVLVKNQTTSSQNGIYQVNAGAWTYATGCTTWAQYVSALVFVEFGGQAGSAWYCTAQPGGTLGTTAMTWSNFSVSSTYTAGTGLTLSGYQFSITNTGVAANTYGSATATPVFAVNAQGQITSVTNTTITPAIGNVTGLATGMLTFLQTPTSANLAATVTDETGSGALVFANSPTFITPALGTPASGVLTNATGLPLTTGVTGILGIANGGTGLSTTPANGALDIGNGTGFTRTTLTAGTAIGITNAAGSITIANNGVTSLTGGTGISVSASTGGVTITNTATMTYPGAGIANSTGSAWGTSYSTSGTGTVVALATSPSFTTPSLGAATATSVTSGSFVANETITGSLSAGAFSYGTLSYTDTSIFASFTSSTNSYNQIVLQNTNSGTTASTDYVVSNNLGTASTYYGDFGMNSSGFSGTGSFNLANAVYLQAMSVDLVIGTGSANTVHFVANGGSTDSAYYNSSGVWTFANTITGSISGNAGTATTATTATNANNIAITDNTSSSSTWYPVLSANSSGNNAATTSSTKMSFVPSTGVLTTIGNTNTNQISNTLTLGGTQNQQIGQGNASIMKNRIINGAMVIDQRNLGTSTTAVNATYAACDRWEYFTSQTGKFSCQQNAGSITPPAGFTNYLGLTSLSAYTPTTNDYFQVQQNIEGYNVADLGWGTANAKTITISFWVYSSLTGTFGGSLINGANSYVYPFSYSIPVANTWTQISITVAGPTSGTWYTTNGLGLSVIFSIGAGSAVQGTAGAWTSTNASTVRSSTGAVNVVATNGATWYITGVQLEVGSYATGFEYRQYQQELALCQRYYYKQTAQTNYTLFGGGIAQTTTTLRTNITLPVTMRIAAVSFDISALNTWLLENSSAINTSSLSAVSTSGNNNANNFQLSWTSSTAVTQGNYYNMYSLNNTTAYIGISAEL